MSKSIIIKGKHNQDKLLTPNKTHKRDAMAVVNKKWFERKQQIRAGEFSLLKY